MTRMPGSAAPTSAPARVRRFSLTERLAHWLLAVTFFVMLASGLMLYLPSLSGITDRPTAKAIHLWSALALPLGIVILLVLGNRCSLARSAREIDRFDRDDAHFLSPIRVGLRRPTPPQGRFNAGQKLNAILVLASMSVMFVTGFFLWYGAHDTRFRFAGTVMVHDWVMFGLILLVAGHLYMAVINPATRHSLRGITAGEVNRDWAAQHHKKWADETPSRD